jgi:hypothetical protein
MDFTPGAYPVAGRFGRVSPAAQFEYFESLGVGGEHPALEFERA